MKSLLCNATASSSRPVSHFQSLLLRNLAKMPALGLYLQKLIDWILAVQHTYALKKQSKPSLSLTELRSLLFGLLDAQQLPLASVLQLPLLLLRVVHYTWKTSRDVCQ